MKKSLAYTVLFWLLIADLATAGDFGVFEMLEGQGVELCEACFKALEALPSDLTGCERPYDPELGLSAPEWTELEPQKHLALLKQVMLLVIPPDALRGIEGTIYDGENFRQEIKSLMKQERIQFALAKMDIDNDGRPEPVLKFRHGGCGDPHPGPGSATFQALIALRPDRKAIDQIKTNVVTQNGGKRPGHPAGNVFSQIYDVFNYQGQLYFDRWDNDGLEPDTFSVYQAREHSVNRLCKYRFERRYRSQEVQGRKP